MITTVSLNTHVVTDEDTSIFVESGLSNLVLENINTEYFLSNNEVIPVVFKQYILVS